MPTNSRAPAWPRSARGARAGAALRAARWLTRPRRARSLFALVLAVPDAGAILEAVTRAGVVLANAKLARLTPQQTAALTVARELPPDAGCARSRPPTRPRARSAR